MDIKENHINPYIISVDACLGRNTSVGCLITGVGPLLPGAALNKPLPSIGDIHITGVVNIGGFMEHSVLQNTRLSIVVDMANKIADLLDILDQRLTRQHTLPAIVSSHLERPVYTKERDLYVVEQSEKGAVPVPSAPYLTSPVILARFLIKLYLQNNS